MDICTCVKVELEDENPSPKKIADSLIHHALKLDRGRPRDDISIVVLRVAPGWVDMIRRMTVIACPAVPLQQITKSSA